MRPQTLEISVIDTIYMVDAIVYIAAEIRSFWVQFVEFVPFLMLSDDSWSLSYPRGPGMNAGLFGNDRRTLS